MAELRLAIRKLVRTPGMTALAPLTLGAGLGATTALWALVNGVLLRPLPYPAPDRLVVLMHTAPGLGVPEFEHSDLTYLHYRQATSSFAAMGAWDDDTVNLVDTGAVDPSEPTRLDALRATPSLLELLGVAPILGRSFAEAEGTPGAPRVALLSYALWQQRYGGRRDIVGRQLALDDQATTVIGVLPRRFAFPDRDTRLVLPLVFDPAATQDTNFSYDVVAKLGPGASPGSAERDLAAALAALPSAHPGTDLTAELMRGAGMRPFVRGLAAQLQGDIATTLWVLLLAVALIFLIACAQAVALQFVRAETAERDLAIRQALGAARSTIARAPLLEGLLIAGLAGLVGAAVAMVLLRLLPASPFAPDIPRLESVGFGAGETAALALLCAGAGVLLGAAPMRRLEAATVLTLLRQGIGQTARKRTQAVRGGLVVAQVAIAILVMVAAALLVRSHQRLQHIDPGFRAADAFTFQLSPPRARYDQRQEITLYERLLEGLRELPPVEVAGMSTSRPFDRGNRNGTSIEDRPSPDGLPYIHANRVVSANYFGAMGMPLLEGGGFTALPAGSRPREAVVSRSLARRHWGDQSPLGKRIQPGGLESSDVNWFTIVGVVADLHDDGLTAAPTESVYYPALLADGSVVDEDFGWSGGSIVVRTRHGLDPAAIIPDVRSVVRALDPQLPISAMTTLSDLLRRESARARFTAALVAMLGLLALSLCALGLFGVVSASVARRQREIGVRQALGASLGDVLALVVGHGLRLVALGGIAGLALALLASRALRSLLFGVTPLDPAAYLGALAALALACAFALVLPARRAAAISPATALRDE